MAYQMSPSTPASQDMHNKNKNRGQQPAQDRDCNGHEGERAWHSSCGVVEVGGKGMREEAVSKESDAGQGVMGVMIKRRDERGGGSPRSWLWDHPKVSTGPRLSSLEECQGRARLWG